jgi:probable HAF family extracellular repeat protein
MKSRISIPIAAVTVCAALAIPAGVAAQQHQQGQNNRHPQYQLIDLGTLGGPHSYGSVNGDGFSLLNNAGVVASYADTSLPDPNQAYFCYSPDCYQGHAFQWTEGVMTDLGALPVDNNSAAGSINARGWITGQSQSDQIDPVLGFPEFRGVLWKQGQIINLGTLGTGTESLGVYVDDAGEVVGFSTTSTAPDPLGFFGFPTHTFIWRNGQESDIGTLGGADTFPGASCGGQPTGVVVGGSSISTAINPATGLPTVDPFVWTRGSMTDLGTLGGAYGFAQCANKRGQIIGHSSTAGNPGACVGEGGGQGCHAFVWSDGVMTDLGTLGGDAAEAIWLNEAGDIVGSADFAGGQLHDAVFWRHGVMYDLGTVPGDPCSRGRGLNASGQVVGGSSDCHNFLHAFLWEKGGPMVDLNTLIQPGTGYQLTNAFNINDRGEILAKAAPLGFIPNDDADLGHVVLLVPCGIGKCDDSQLQVPGTQPGRSAPFYPDPNWLTTDSHPGMFNPLRNPFEERYRILNQRPAPHD